MQPKSVLAKVDLDVCVFAYVCLCENNLSYVAKPACDSWLAPKVSDGFETAPSDCDNEWGNGQNHESNNHWLFYSILWAFF